MGPKSGSMGVLAQVIMLRILYQDSYLFFPYGHCYLAINGFLSARGTEAVGWPRMVTDLVIGALNMES